MQSYLAAGGNADARDGKGQTALQFACSYGKSSVVELLLRAGADTGLARDKGAEWLGSPLCGWHRVCRPHFTTDILRGERVKPLQSFLRGVVGRALWRL